MYGWVPCQPRASLSQQSLWGRMLINFNHHGNYDHHDEVLHLKSPFHVAVSSNIMVVLGVDKIYEIGPYARKANFLFCSFEMFFFTCADTSFGLINVYLRGCVTCRDM